MTSISNKSLIDQIITSNKLDNTVDACFEVFQLDRNSTTANIKKLYRKFCLGFHPDDNSFPCASKVMKIMNQ